MCAPVRIISEKSGISLAKWKLNCHLISSLGIHTVGESLKDGRYFNRTLYYKHNMPIVQKEGSMLFIIL